MGSTVYANVLTHALAKFETKIERMAWSTVRAVVGEELDRRLAMRDEIERRFAMRKRPRARPIAAAPRSLQARSRKRSARARASPAQISRSQRLIAPSTGPDCPPQVGMTDVIQSVSSAQDQLGAPHGGGAGGPMGETRRHEATRNDAAAEFSDDANSAAAVLEHDGNTDLVRRTRPIARQVDGAALAPAGPRTSISCPGAAELRLRLIPNVDPERFDGEALAQMQRDQWGEGNASRMTRLVLSFPTLTDADGVEPWNPEALIAWACDHSLDEDCAHAVRFALHLWQPTNDWRTEAANVLRQRGHSVVEAQSIASAFMKFDVISALGSWDHLHQAAFLAWVGVPFYP